MKVYNSFHESCLNKIYKLLWCTHILQGNYKGYANISIQIGYELNIIKAWLNNSLSLSLSLSPLSSPLSPLYQQSLSIFLSPIFFLRKNRCHLFQLPHFIIVALFSKQNKNYEEYIFIFKKRNSKRKVIFFEYI